MKIFILIIQFLIYLTCNSQIPSINVSGFKPKPVVMSGDAVWTTAGTYSWTVPDGVTSICVVCIGGGGGGDAWYDIGMSAWYGSAGGGGGLGYANNITVTPGESLTVIVGAAGIGGVVNNYSLTTYSTDGGASLLKRGATNLVYGNGGKTSIAGSDMYAGDYFADGGTFSPNGGNGGSASNNNTCGNSGLYTGTGGTTSNNNLRGNGSSLYGSTIALSTSNPGGGGYGSGGGWFDGSGSTSMKAGGTGGVRVLWGTGRSFPSTNVSTSTN